MKFAGFLLLVLMFTAPAIAGDWTSYTNARFGETIDIPPGFVNDVGEPENGDGLTFHSADGKAELLVWGNNLVDEDFKADGQSRVSDETANGWDVSYQKDAGEQWSVYSGSKGERIMYARAIASCKGTQALHFRIEYPGAQKKEYDAIVDRLSKSLKAPPDAECS
jgi:hypothetical protein